MKKPHALWERKLTFKQRDEIIIKHFEKRISQTQLAKDYGVSRRMIWLYCRRKGTSPLQKFYTMDDKSIVNMFLNEQMSVKAIADKLEVSTRPIKRRLKLAGINYKPKTRRLIFKKEVPNYTLKTRIWSAKVIERDELKCKWCKALDNGKNPLQAHHITPVRYIENVDDLFDLKNGITLCRKCHMKIHYKEKEFEVFFRNLIQGT